MLVAMLMVSRATRLLVIGGRNGYLERRA